MNRKASAHVVRGGMGCGTKAKAGKNKDKPCPEFFGFEIHANKFNAYNPGRPSDYLRMEDSFVHVREQVDLYPQSPKFIGM